MSKKPINLLTNNTTINTITLDIENVKLFNKIVLTFYNSSVVKSNATLLLFKRHTPLDF